MGWNAAIIPPSRDQRWRKRWKTHIFHPHVTKGGEDGGKFVFSTMTWWKNSTLGWNASIIPPSRHQRWRKRWKTFIFHLHVTKGGGDGGKLLVSTITWWNLKMHVDTDVVQKLALSIPQDHLSYWKRIQRPTVQVIYCTRIVVRR